MTRLTTRLRNLEKSWRPKPATPTIRAFFHRELIDCTEHKRCGIEPETGVHHRGLIRLTLEDPRQ